VRAAIYARVSTAEQTCENQLLELRRYVEVRGWTAKEYVDEGVSGAKDRRPALDQLLADAKRRRFDVLVCWRLDRLGRSLKHLITLLDDLQALGVAFVSLAEGIDATTPAGKLQMHILGAIAEFERERIRERVLAGLRRARAQGRRLGRPRKAPAPISVPGGTVREAARLWDVSKSTAARWIAAGKTGISRTAPSALPHARGSLASSMPENRRHRRNGMSLARTRAR
jgi:DNA invertase Pin-like site-specific DNA recombinase